MIDAARRFYQERYSDDYWLEVLEKAYADALIARAEKERLRRQTPPNYAILTPGDLQERVKSALGGE